MNGQNQSSRIMLDLVLEILLFNQREFILAIDLSSENIKILKKIRILTQHYSSTI